MLGQSQLLLLLCDLLQEKGPVATKEVKNQISSFFVVLSISKNSGFWLYFDMLCLHTSM